MVEKQIKWQKRGRGIFYLRGQAIREGQQFHASPSEISVSFRDLIKPLEPLPEEGGNDEPEIIPAEYSLHARGNGWFDVVNNRTEKVLNDRSLRKADAEAYLAKLDSEPSASAEPSVDIASDVPAEELPAEEAPAEEYEGNAGMRRRN